MTDSAAEGGRGEAAREQAVAREVTLALISVCGP